MFCLDLAAEDLVARPAAGTITAGSAVFFSVAGRAGASTEGGSAVPVAAGRSRAVLLSLVASGAVGHEVVEGGSTLVGVVAVGDCGDGDANECSSKSEESLHGDLETQSDVS